jgi:hypothetical protein
MKSIRLVLALIITLLLTAGCATGPRFTGLEPITPGKSRIYVVRESKIFGSAMTFDVLMDGAKMGTLANGGYLTQVTSPGSHRMNARTSLIVATADRSTVVQVPPDGNAFVRVEVRSFTPNSWTYVFNPITEEEAMKLLPNLSLSANGAKTQLKSP